MVDAVVATGLIRIHPTAGGPVAAQANVDENGPVHPLASGSEAYYTYRTGDSITLTLPDKRPYRLHSLEVRPRSVEALKNSPKSCANHSRASMATRSLGW